MGYVMRSGRADGTTIQGVPRPVRAGARLALRCVIVTATLFGIAAGTVGATVTLLGIMAGPMMIRAGYDVRMSAGAIAAGGTLGILIPPSVMLVVMAPVLDISIIDLYAAAFGPGFLLSVLYIVYRWPAAPETGKLGPPVPMASGPGARWKVVRECVSAWFRHRPDRHYAWHHSRRFDDPTEAASSARSAPSCWSRLRTLSWSRVVERDKTLATTSMVLFLAVSSTVFGAVFTRLGTTT